MTSPFTTHAFIAGELDRAFYGRNDLDKYALGVAHASNFYIDFRGGLKSRSGFMHRDYFLPNSRSFEFFVGEDQPPIMVCLLPGRTFFWSDQGFLTDPELAIASISTNEITLSNASSLSVGDFLYSENFRYLLRITAKATNTITVEMLDGQTPDIPAGTEVYPLLELSNIYDANDLLRLTGHYRLDRLVFTVATKSAQALVFDNSSFSFVPEVQTPVLAQPSGLTVSTYRRSGPQGDATLALTAGNAHAIWVVTAVDVDGNESLPSRPLRQAAMFNYTAEGGNATISWNAVLDAVSYRVYRSIITENASINITAQTGYLGETRTNTFVDNNFIPDFTVQPSRFFSPFKPSAVLNIQMTNQGAGYNPNTATVSIATGTGFIGYPVVEPGFPDPTALPPSGGGIGGSSSGGVTANTTGPITGVLIYANGTGYTISSAVTFSGGTGATAAVKEVSPASGIFPGVSTVFQQRRIYAASTALPLTIFGSQPGDEQNFNSGVPPLDSDSYAISLDAEEVVPIRHLLPMRAGLITMTSKGIFRLFGRDDGAVTPNQYVLETQAEVGVGRPKPAVISNDILFSSNRGSSFHALAYTFYTNSYTPQEISILAPHLFGEEKAPKRMVWTEEPDKLLWVLREDGALLSLTYMKEQEIFAWAQHHTDGFIRDICSYSRPDRDSMILFIERDGTTFIEELAPRRVTSVEEYWGSDNSIGLSFVEPVTEVTGLWHLEGLEVQILADGDVLARQTVTDGAISFGAEASVLRIGIPYECLGISLPLSDQQLIVNGRLRRIVGSAVRLFETRGLEIGTALNRMFEMKDKSWENWSVVTALRSDNSVVLHKSTWERDAQIYFRQRYPLPATVLGYVTEMEIER